ncbi:pullulanase-type alpha-1,6-glucosidase [Arsenicicoccus piscis]|uniref:pullulanase-type alpha-1,6-glucosidase n=1 Tax=Arsenicicoccus piscis TaxID=673954 RepID=UPI001F4C822B|nr:pullulanase-type alpha-1,6-glucosidase [Arsenicicoccus piscis]MCH8627829.1 pullulanase-type alpha-1,6-glucosidase [Arsenicicoccus piscis]
MGLTVPTASTAAAADPAPDRIVTLYGSLQSELGCTKDWDPACTATALTKTGPSTYARTFTVPAGSWEIKVAVNGSTDEAYGAGGAKGGANIPLVLKGPAAVSFSYDDSTHQIGMTPTTLAGAATKADQALATDSLRPPLTRERFYFVMADRFANGDRANDTGGLTGGRLETGFDPTDKGFYHGGDLKGLTQRLDYIKGLGMSAIWLTPSFKNRPVQGTGADASAGYHGYWITDFTQIDPHLGTNADMKALVAAAHAKGMKVFFDIITNHTADVLDNSAKKYDYVSKATVPYKDASGTPFDDRDYINKTFPPLSAATSFPYPPVFRTEADRTVKVPAWLNDPTMYHNRGDSTYAGESSTYGDFAGLDDLFTERPEVVKGMGDIYKSWVDFGIDGFRIDTVKHVNLEFWQQWAPSVLEHARSRGNKDFFMFGEVYDGDPKVMSTYTTAGKLQATLDFGFQGAALGAVQGKATTGLRDFFASDDWYTDTDSNAYELPTFLGNHDMGRVAMMLSKAGYTGSDLLKRLELANALMFTTRGQPVVYYGDEQGFAGAGGDKDARQDMFATKVAQYATEANVLGAGAKDRYDTSSVLYRQVAALSALRSANPALADGAQVHRFASDQAGIYAFSRIDKATGTEYVVALNTAATTAGASFSTYLRNGGFTPLYGSTSTLRSGKDGRVTVSVPGLGLSVWKSRSSIRGSGGGAASPVYLTSPSAGGVVGGRAEIGAAIPAGTFAEVSFAYRPVGTSAWTPLGTDDNAPYRVFADVSGMAKGTLVEYRAVAKDLRGRVTASSSYGIVGDAAAAPTGPGSVGPVTQPDAVSVPGAHNSEMGCAADWAPDCAQAQLALDPKDQIWKGTYATLPAGEYSYKAAINKSWDENYGAGGAAGGGNITYTAPGGPVTFYYDHATHYVTSTAQGPIITAPGSYQNALGCGGDWMPDCMKPWLQDPDGDGVYTWSSAQIPAGSYEFKIAHGLTWDENYGAGGTLKGDNISLSVPSAGTVVTLSYTLATHQVTVKTSKAGSAPDLAKAKAIWVDRDTIAWPASAVPAGTSPALLRWRLHWAAGGGLAVDAESITAPGSQQAGLRYDPAGLPASVVAAHPELKGYLALQLSGSAARNAETILRGQVAVGLYDATGRVLDATGVQVPLVLDDLYARSAVKASFGAVPSRSGAFTFRVWAPTAQDVSLVTWPAGSAADAPVASGTTRAMQRASDGSWSVTVPRAGGMRYLYQVGVYAPTAKKVVRNLVTDPYSVALTLDSTRSVAIDLSDRAFAPAMWRSTPQPVVRQQVDQSIYELHVRDFSIGDTTVPAEHRGSYLAFADAGNGTKHLQALAKAGLTTVHLLPTFDIASIPENPAKQKSPACDLRSMGPAGEGQQKCVAAVADQDGYNWGYDPWHWMAPEGSYTSTAAAADGGARVAEFRTMVGALHRDGLQVVLDQVFNHTPASGQADKSVLDKIVPGYYQRLDAQGAVYTSTCCQNVATEHALAEKAMVDAVVVWARDYKVDGFRFDLMGHHSRSTMLKVRAALDALTPVKDGVDGKRVFLYGEGWNFGEVADNALFVQATQGQLGGTHIASFNDRIRDAVRGGGPFDDDPRRQGFATGELTSPNGAAINAEAATRLKSDTDLLALGLAGNLKTFAWTGTAGKALTGATTPYNGAVAGFADQPDEVINYVDAHDNETLFDALTYKLPTATSMSDRVRANTLALATTALSQSPSFWHAGADLLRSKSLDRDSYNSGDWFNTLDWTGADNGFGHGLPPAASNSAKWPFMKPLLANSALKPGAADVQHATQLAQELLRLRYSSALFRLGSADQIKAKLTFPASGTPAAHPGVLVMRLDDTVGRPVDPQLSGLVVVFNATPTAVKQQVPGLAGKALTLSPVQAGGVDPIVKTTTWDAASGTATVPAWTVSVLVQR